MTSEIDVKKIMEDIKTKSQKNEIENFGNNLLNHKNIQDFLHEKVSQRKKSTIYKEIQKYLKKSITKNEYIHFNENELEKNLILANENTGINIHKPILSNRNKVTRGLALKVRNLIQNEIRFTLDPIIKNQEDYNSYNIRIINQIARYLEKLNVEKEESYDKLSAEEKKNHDKLSAELQLNYDTLSAELQDTNYTLSEELKESHNNLIKSHIRTIKEIVNYVEKLNVEKEENYEKLNVELKENYEKLKIELEKTIITEFKKTEKNVVQDDKNLKSFIKKTYSEILERTCLNDEIEYYFLKIKKNELKKTDLSDIFKNSEEYRTLKDCKKSFHEYSSKIIKPIIIFGVFRSGTTLVHSILCENSKLAWFSDEDIERWLSLEEQFAHERYHRWLEQNNKKIPISEASLFVFGKNGPGLKHFGTPPKGTKKIPIEGELFWKAKFGLDYISDVDIVTKTEIVKEIANVIKNQSKERFVCKAPMHSMRLFALKKIFPDAKFINVARDPRPVINSILQRLTEEGQFEPGIPVLDELKFSVFGPVEKFALIYKELTEHIHQFYEKYPDNFLTVYYEELIKNPKSSFKEIFEFCDLDTNLIDEVIPLIKPINEKWKDKISLNKQKKIFDIVLPALSKMKYPYKI